MTNPIKFYADENVPIAIVKGLERRNVDIRTSKSARMLGASDKKQLAYSLKHERVIVTFDDDFLRLHSKGEEHNGIIFISKKASLGYIIRKIM
ncbi:MAG: hypothetical protein A2161_18160 [Candidatus Schekmanbacteria bacterium RBG_13_48_7]|uniref:DUF5615 domain-containing protein n=1 Tax=Candidatus Schekmanbacteria bacterium RBG_13_48_7 TaxID=1817878 RepID=A0A1F7RQT4_9BACT|nr:MAG: hypothetical protein A2161_18160 [Candidatus Schekmanbacteria bacterium RBG_13_48_7]